MVRVFTWLRSAAPLPLTGDASGVAFYNVSITGPVAVTDVVADIDCTLQGTTRCEFSTPTLIAGSYVLKLNAVDRVGNADVSITKAFRAGPALAVQNLRVTGDLVQPVFVDPVLGGTVNTGNPQFQWTPPVRLPNGLNTYEVAITADAAFVSFTDEAFFVAQCFTVTGDLIGTGVVCTQDPATGDDVEIRLTVKQAVADSTHTLKVLVVDLQDGRGLPVDLTFTVDTTPPDAPVLVSPAALPARDAFLNTSTPLFDWNAAEGQPFDYRLQVVVSGDDFVIESFVVNSGDLTETEFQPSFGLPDDTYRWRVIARDRALNVGEPSNGDFTVDTVPPDPPAALVAPADDAFLNITIPFFDWEAPASTADLFDYVLQVTSGDIEAGSFDIEVVVAGDTTEFQAVGNLADATYRWRVLARDRALNVAKTGDRTFTVDTVAPEPPPLVTPQDGAFLNVTTPFFDWDASPSTEDVFDYLLQVTSGGLATGSFDIVVVVQHPTTEFQASVDLADASYEWRVIAGDRALNTSSSVSRAFSVDTIRPTVPAGVTEVTSPAAGDPPEATGDLSSSLVRVFTFKRSVDPVPPTGTTGDESGVGFYNVSITGPVAVTDVVADIECTLELNTLCGFTTPTLVPGFYVMKLSAADRAGNIGDVATVNFRAGPLVAVQNLKVVDAVFVEPLGLGGAVNTVTPKFQWNPPLPDRLEKFGVGVVRDYEVAITADAALVPFTEEALFLAECFTEAGGEFEGPVCTTALVADDVIQISVKVDLPDGTHIIGIRVIGTDVDGFPINGSLVQLPFTVDTTPPDIGTPVKISPDEENAPTFTFDSVDVHTDVVTFHRVHIESEAFIDVTVPPIPGLVSPTEKLFSGDVSTFSWTQVKDDISAVSYILEIDFATGDFTKPKIREVSIPDVPITGDTIQFTLPQDNRLTSSGDFIWHVRAVDRAGNIGDFSKARSFVLGIDTEPPSRPTLLSPLNRSETDDTTPEFLWSRVTTQVREDGTEEDENAGVEFFNLKIESDTLLITADGIIGTRFIPVEPLPTTADGIKYTWRVQAVDRAGNEGAFSDPSTFTIIEDITPPAKPTLAIPSDRSVTDDPTPTFAWNRVVEDIKGRVDISGVESFRLEVDFGTGTADFTELHFALDGIRVTQFTLPQGAALPGTGDFVWRVRAVDLAGNTGDFSDPFTFTLVEDITPPAKPSLISPAEGSTGGNPTPTFTWSRVFNDTSGFEDVSGVKSYILEIGFGTGDFTDLAFTANGIQETQLILPDNKRLATGNYIWHVRAVDQAGNTGDFSDPFTFTILTETTPPAAPSLISPPNGATGSNTTPTLTWSGVVNDISSTEDVSGVESYTLEIGFGTGDFTDLAFTADRIQETQFTLPGNKPLVTGDYIWHVRAVDGVGNTGDFSEPFTFAITGDAPDLGPILIAPLNGLTLDDSTPKFIWSPVTGDLSLVSYKLEIGLGTADFANVAFAADNIQQAQFTVPEDSALATGEYVWHVVVSDGAGNSGDGLTFTFKLVEDATPPAAPTLISPPDGATGRNTTPTFTWSRVTDPSGVTYTLEIAIGDPLTGDFSDPVFSRLGITGGDSAIAFTLSTGDALATGDYIWHVVAVDGAGNTADSSEIRSFAITADAPTPTLEPVLISPEIGVTLDDTTPTFTWTPVTGDLSPVTYTLEIATGDQPTTGSFDNPVFATGNIQETQFILAENDALTARDYIWHVVAEDGVGNTGDSVAFTFGIVEDVTPPAPPTLVFPPEGATGGNTTPTFTWSAVTDPSGVIHLGDSNR